MTFKGLCIGGPLDGQWLEWEKPTYIKPILSAEPLPISMVVEGVVPQKVTTENYTYKHQVADGITFWTRPHLPFPFVLERLAECYRPRTGSGRF